MFPSARYITREPYHSGAEHQLSWSRENVANCCSGLFAGAIFSMASFINLFLPGELLALAAIHASVTGAPAPHVVSSKTSPAIHAVSDNAGFVNENKTWDRQLLCFCCDGFGIGLSGASRFSI